MKKKIMIGGGIVLLVGISVGASLFLGSKMNQQTVVVEVIKEVEPPPTFYYSFKPEFVVNVGPRNSAQYLMLELSASMEGEELMAVMDEHSPELRNDLLMLFGAQDPMVLHTPEGKNELRANTLIAIQEVIMRHKSESDAEALKGVFFTRFVVQ